MAIIQNATVEQAQLKTAQQIRSMINQQAEQLLKTAPQVWALVWQNPYKLTPQQAFDAMKTDAVNLCEISSAAAVFMNTLVADSFPVKTPQPLTMNQDGTVKVG